MYKNIHKSPPEGLIYGIYTHREYMCMHLHCKINTTVIFKLNNVLLEE